MEGSKERILRAATWGRSPTGPKLYVGKSHARIKAIIYRRNNRFPHPKDEGFVTNRRRFVGPIEALSIAINAGQVKQLQSIPYANLISEDLRS
ncbi:MAG: hypothetical protein AAB573_03905 [Patescibacteria group bacterium]